MAVHIYIYISICHIAFFPSFLFFFFFLAVSQTGSRSFHTSAVKLAVGSWSSMNKKKKSLSNLEAKHSGLRNSTPCVCVCPNAGAAAAKLVRLLLSAPRERGSHPLGSSGYAQREADSICKRSLSPFFGPVWEFRGGLNYHIREKVK